MSQSVLAWSCNSRGRLLNTAAAPHDVDRLQVNGTVIANSTLREGSTRYTIRSIKVNQISWSEKSDRHGHTKEATLHFMRRRIGRQSILMYIFWDLRHDHLT